MRKVALSRRRGGLDATPKAFNGGEEGTRPAPVAGQGDKDHGGVVGKGPPKQPPGFSVSGNKPPRCFQRRWGGPREKRPRTKAGVG